MRSSNTVLCYLSVRVHRNVSDSIHLSSVLTRLTMVILQRPWHGKLQAQLGM